MTADATDAIAGAWASEAERLSAALHSQTKGALPGYAPGASRQQVSLFQQRYRITPRQLLKAAHFLRSHDRSRPQSPDANATSGASGHHSLFAGHHSHSRRARHLPSARRTAAGLRAAGVAAPGAPNAQPSSWTKQLRAALSGRGTVRQ